MDERPLNVRTEYQDFSQEHLKTIQQSLSKNFSILLFNIRTNGNVGMIIRSACLLGCKQIVICGRKKYDARFTTGAHHYIPIVYNENILKVDIKCKALGTFEEIVNYCLDNSFTPIFLEQGGTDIQSISWKIIDNPLIVIGNESLGIPRNFILTVKSLIPQTIITSIPQYSVMRSLNVSVAASIAMWEISKVV